MREGEGEENNSDRRFVRAERKTEGGTMRRSVREGGGEENKSDGR